MLQRWIEFDLLLETAGEIEIARMQLLQTV